MKRWKWLVLPLSLLVLSAASCGDDEDCGNGFLDAGEQCDDGNNINGDGCENTCTITVVEAVCGDGVVEGAEQCDDGNDIDDDACSNACTTNVVEAVCGDGVTEGDEECDDGNLDNGDGCEDDCTVTLDFCSNGIQEAGEECDDGNLDNGDGCEDDCTITLDFCSNGILEAGEECDDGNLDNDDGCSASCLIETEAYEISGDGLGLAIPDDGYDGSLGSMACTNLEAVASQDGYNHVYRVALEVGIAHTWVGDLTIKVVSPSNTVFTVLSRPGHMEAADNGVGGIGDSSNLLATSPLTFIDGGTTDAEELGASDANTNAIICQDDALCEYFPNKGAAIGEETFFDAFSFEASVGNWQVCVGDSSGNDIGSLESAKLTFERTKL